jgi:hypothetical protein
MMRASPRGIWAWKQTASGWTSPPSSRSCSATCVETNLMEAEQADAYAASSCPEVDPIG